MNGKEKLENLTHAWYGFVVLSAAATFLMNGIGVFSLVFAAIGTFIGLCITFVLGRLLINRSGATRVILVGLSGLLACLSVIGVASSLWSFVGEWSFARLASAGSAAVLVYMHGRSFRVLTDKSVKAYFA